MSAHEDPVDCLQAAATLEGISNVDVLAAEWLRHGALHLRRRADVWLRGGVRLPSTEQAAIALIRGTADELRAAGLALDKAAEVLRAAGQGFAASQAKQAGTQ